MARRPVTVTRRRSVTIRRGASASAANPRPVKHPYAWPATIVTVALLASVTILGLTGNLSFNTEVAKKKIEAQVTMNSSDNERLKVEARQKTPVIAAVVPAASPAVVYPPRPATTYVPSPVSAPAAPAARTVQLPPGQVADCDTLQGIRTINPTTGKPSCFVP